MLTTEFKNRSTLRTVKNIFSDIQSFSGEGQLFIQGFFKNSLSAALDSFVALIQ